jgi:hypothetical protein
MKKYLSFLGVSAALGALVLALPAPSPIIKSAKANITVMCAPQLADTAAARTIGGQYNSNTPGGPGGSAGIFPSGTTYVLNGQGCTLAQQADLGVFLSLGFTPGPPFGQNIIYTTGVQTGTTSLTIGTIPANAYLQHVIVQNNTANPITGGLNFGVVGGSATAIASALAVAGSVTVIAADSALTRIQGTTAPAAYSVTVAAQTTWNNANVTITLVYGYY